LSLCGLTARPPFLSGFVGQGIELFENCPSAERGVSQQSRLHTNAIANRHIWRLRRKENEDSIIKVARKINSGTVGLAGAEGMAGQNQKYLELGRPTAPQLQSIIT
jgi:hypothetical protein